MYFHIGHTTHIFYKEESIWVKIGVGRVMVLKFPEIT